MKHSLAGRWPSIRLLVSIGVVVGGLLGAGCVQAAGKNKDCVISPTSRQTLPGAERFVGVFGELVGRFLRFAAYCDRETGLIWERTPDLDTREWAEAIGHCAKREVGGRKGWHLPSRGQLASLVDTSNHKPALPTGHPFDNVQSVSYWSASTADFPPTVWIVDFLHGQVSDVVLKDDGRPAWCVRGGQVFDGNTHSGEGLPPDF